MKTQVAAFQSGSSVCLLSFTPFGCGEWVQLTEFVEVELTDLPKQEIIDKQIESIDEKNEEENGKHYAEIKRLEQKKAELLAITYESGAVADHLTDNETLEDDYNVK